MKKKCLLVITLCILLFTFCACSFNDEKTQNYNGYSYEKLKSLSSQYVEEIDQIAEDENYDSIKESGQLSGEQVKAIDNWKQSKKEYGGEDYKFGKFSVTKTGKTLTTDQVIHLEKRDVEFELVYTYSTMKVSSFTFNVVYSLGEKMADAGKNTIVSVSIVFGMLALISVVIYSFKIFAEPNQSKKNVNNANMQDEAKKTQEVKQTMNLKKNELEEKELEEKELVAVIAAAIASYEGRPVSDFIVRSIKRR
ncbi:Oxaloacetate decarboxylase, gamma chain [Lachnospiraceae bacterium C7]|nr:Oxaloacetate decarboxylase, gamma chain [Lachnospiraceae bacterium C7]